MSRKGEWHPLLFFSWCQDMLQQLFLEQPSPTCSRIDFATWTVSTAISYKLQKFRAHAIQGIQTGVLTLPCTPLSCLLHCLELHCRGKIIDRPGTCPLLHRQSEDFILNSQNGLAGKSLKINLTTGNLQMGGLSS